MKRTIVKEDSFKIKGRSSNNPNIRRIITHLYDNGFYIPFNQIQLLNIWMRAGYQEGPWLYEQAVRQKLFRSEQAARNAVVNLKSRGIYSVRGKLIVGKVKKNNEFRNGRGITVINVYLSKSGRKKII